MRGILRRLSAERGYALPTAVILTAVMLTVGMSTFATVGTQQGESRKERERESSFNFAEGALYAQEFILARGWPGNSADEYPTTCTPASNTEDCPTAAALRQALDSAGQVDLREAENWTLRVRDNSGASLVDYQSDTNSQPRWDSNGDQRVWVRSDAVVHGRTRSVVGLLELERFAESFPDNVITAGKFQSSNSGNKVLVDTKGNSVSGSQVVVRCEDDSLPPPPPANNACVSYDTKGPQVSPERVYQDLSTPNGMTTSQLSRFRSQAQVNGTYFTDCPGSIAGEVVFVDLAAFKDCGNYSGTFNSDAAPGLVIFTNGKAAISSSQTTYYGLVYMANLLNSCDYLFRIHSNATLRGGVAVDGCGGVEVGSDKYNLIFDTRAFSTLQTFGTAGLVQNTWRELPPGT